MRSHTMSASHVPYRRDVQDRLDPHLNGPTQHTNNPMYNITPLLASQARFSPTSCSKRGWQAGTAVRRAFPWAWAEAWAETRGRGRGEEAGTPIRAAGCGSWPVGVRAGRQPLGARPVGPCGGCGGCARRWCGGSSGVASAVGVGVGACSRTEHTRAHMSTGSHIRTGKHLSFL